jgi:hypothetical protein
LILPALARLAVLLFHTIPFNPVVVFHYRVIIMKVEAVGESQGAEDARWAVLEAGTQVYIGLKIFVKKVGHPTPQQDIGIAIAPDTLVLYENAPFGIAESVLK